MANKTCQARSIRKFWSEYVSGTLSLLVVQIKQLHQTLTNLVMRSRSQKDAIRVRGDVSQGKLACKPHSWRHFLHPSRGLHLTSCADRCDLCKVCGRQECECRQDSHPRGQQIYDTAIQLWQRRLQSGVRACGRQELPATRRAIRGLLIARPTNTCPAVSARLPCVGKRVYAAATSRSAFFIFRRPPLVRQTAATSPIRRGSSALDGMRADSRPKASGCNQTWVARID